VSRKVVWHGVRRLSSQGLEHVRCRSRRPFCAGHARWLWSSWRPTMLSARLRAAARSRTRLSSSRVEPRGSPENVTSSTPRRWPSGPAGGCLSASAGRTETFARGNHLRAPGSSRQSRSGTLRWPSIGVADGPFLASSAHGVQRHDAVLQRKLVQQLRHGGDLVRLAVHAALAQTLTACRADCSRPWSNERLTVLPSMATTSRSSRSASEPTQAVNPAWKASGSISMNTRRKVSCKRRSPVR